MWACTDRAKDVAANIKKNKANFGPQLTKEQVSSLSYLPAFSPLVHRRVFAKI